MSAAEVMYQAPGYLPGPRRLAVVIAVSVAANIAVVTGLALVAEPPAPPARETARKVPITLAAPPPPPPPPAAKPVKAPALAAPTPSPATPPLPDLALPALDVPTSGLTLPSADDSTLQGDARADVPRWKTSDRPEVTLEGGEPVLMARPDLDRFYPRKARAAKIVGQTWLTVEVGPRGRVTRAQVDASQPRGIFERAARRAAMKLRYQPGTRGGRPVASKAKVHFKWGL